MASQVFDWIRRSAASYGSRTVYTDTENVILRR